MSEANRHAQSKDPYNPSAPCGVWEFFTVLPRKRIGKGTSSTRATEAPNQERGFNGAAPSRQRKPAKRERGGSRRPA